MLLSLRLMDGFIALSKAVDIRLVGGKAKALGELMRAGFNVPGGFVVTTAADGNLKPALESFDKLGAERVAVRSSGVAEDGANDAWAGQMDSFLNVNKGELLDKIQACFESSKSDRARAYAKERKINAGKVAVIVQKMVPAQISGVAFSAHPVTGDLNQIIIEAVKGLGEKLVSGIATPDTYVVDKKNQTIIEKHLPGKEQSLPEARLQEISRMIIKIEELFGFPVDVEWAYSDGQLFILQSRPITTLG